MCSTCEMYATHIATAVKGPTVVIPSHQIEHAFRDVWPHVVNHIEGEAVDEAHGKLSWYRD